ncbi:MAG: hypothetical protein ACE3L7_32385 [Candidatus Pristimantibacillus sp.]
MRILGNEVVEGSAAEAADKAMASWKKFTDSIQESRIRRALDASGYTAVEPTEKNLKECFNDYIASGIGSNHGQENMDELTVTDMIRTMIGLKI